jgi:hypothetical protein
MWNFLAGNLAKNRLKKRMDTHQGMNLDGAFGRSNGVNIGGPCMATRGVWRKRGFKCPFSWNFHLFLLFLFSFFWVALA